MRIILFRHGEHENDNLTRTGIANVGAVGKQLKDFNIKRIYSSPAKRCVQTAQILAEIVGVADVQLQTDLNERFQLHHAPTNALEQEWWDNYMNLNYNPTNNLVGETCHDYISRNHKVFKKIIKDGRPGEDILIVAHSSTSYALTSFVWKPAALQWMKIGNANYIVFEI